jgi:hypothetical protein
MVSHHFYSPRCEPHKILGGEPKYDSLDGTDQGFGTPSFPSHPSHDGNVIDHIRGPGPASLSSGYGRRIVPSNLGPLLEGHGVLWRAGRRLG